MFIINKNKILKKFYSSDMTRYNEYIQYIYEWSAVMSSRRVKYSIIHNIHTKLQQTHTYMIVCILKTPLNIDSSMSCDYDVL